MIMCGNKIVFFYAFFCLTYANYSLQQQDENIPTKFEETDSEDATFSDTHESTEHRFESSGETISESFTINELSETSGTEEGGSAESNLNQTSFPKDNGSTTMSVISTTLQGETRDSAETTEASTTQKTSTVGEQNINETLENGEHPWWYKDALKDIAYYLRAHKFNEYDRRYNRNGTNVERTNFQYFPKPPLRSLHWEVHRYCDISFLHCVDYLRKKLKHVALRRQDDTSVIAQESDWGVNATRMTGLVDMECRRMRKIDNDIAPPFEGPLERYQWRATASYFMCWYTMNEVPDLRHLGENCDNFAYCLDASHGPNNEDIRANDIELFACAQYSFCPDPCCPNKHLPRKEFCWNDEKNPCFHESPEGQRECGFERIKNTDFSDMILNRWNVTCKCPQEGYVWSSLYGLCVDIDECATSKLHGCTSEGQACLNFPGSFSCVCKWGYTYDETKQKCMASEAIADIKLNSEPKKEVESARDKWKKFVRAVLRVIGKPSSSNRCTASLFLLGYNIFIFRI